MSDWTLRRPCADLARPCAWSLRHVLARTSGPCAPPSGTVWTLVVWSVCLCVPCAHGIRMGSVHRRSWTGRVVCCPNLALLEKNLARWSLALQNCLAFLARPCATLRTLRDLARPCARNFLDTSLRDLAPEFFR